jgi:hypothetical protein
VPLCRMIWGGKLWTLPWAWRYRPGAAMAVRPFVNPIMRRELWTGAFIGISGAVFPSAPVLREDRLPGSPLGAKRCWSPPGGARFLRSTIR